MALHINTGDAMNSWLLEVREHLAARAPEMLGILDVYAAEARFGRSFISNDLSNLEKGATVLEVGAGSMLLSCQLVREGFDVTALEPVGDGFTHFERMKTLILDLARLTDCAPKIVDVKAEDFCWVNCFDYAFSVNVMEHVENVDLAIKNIVQSIKTSTTYRFTCPNYWFPYEPHFNIPTIITKKITEKVFWRKIAGNKKLPDPIGTWRSLNWISVAKIKKTVKAIEKTSVRFNRNFLTQTLNRVTTDKEFAKRRSGFVVIVIKVLVAIGLHRFTALIPVSLQPIIDCSIMRVEG